jgi:GTP-binding protein
LNGRSFAIALTRSDALLQEEAVEKTATFIKEIGLETGSKSKFGFEDGFPFYEQDDKEGTIPYDTSKPLFVAPISSVMHTNIDGLRYALNDLVKKNR